MNRELGHGTSPICIPAQLLPAPHRAFLERPGHLHDARHLVCLWPESVGVFIVISGCVIGFLWEAFTVARDWSSCKHPQRQRAASYVASER